MNESWVNLLEAMTMPSPTAKGTKPLVFEIVTAEQFEVISEILAAVTMVIALSGVCVNAINIKTFLMMGIEDGVSATFLTLSVSDFCYTLVTFIQNLALGLSTWEKRYKHNFNVDPFAVAFFGANVGLTIYMVTTLTTTYLAIVRCICVAKPLHFKNMFTRRKSTMILSTFPVCAIVSQAPVFAHMGMSSRYDSTSNSSRLVLWLSDDRERVKDIVRLIFDTYLSFFAQLIVIICVIVMTSKLKQSVRFRHAKDSTNTEVNKESQPQKLSGKERSVVMQVVIISTIYVICNTCKIFTAFFTLVNSKFDMGKPYQFFYLLMSNSRTTFDCINSSANFYVYLIFNQKFRSLCFTCRRK